jgi:hypothetical protein
MINMIGFENPSVISLTGHFGVARENLVKLGSYDSRVIYDDDRKAPYCSASAVVRRPNAT